MCDRILQDKMPRMQEPGNAHISFEANNQPHRLKPPSYLTCAHYRDKQFDRMSPFFIPVKVSDIRDKNK